MPYVETLLQKLGNMDLSEGGLYMINVNHEPWCNLLTGKGECNCNPEVNLEKKEVGTKPGSLKL